MLPALAFCHSARLSVPFSQVDSRIGSSWCTPSCPRSCKGQLTSCFFKGKLGTWNMTTPLVLKIVNLGQVEASLFTKSLTRMDFLMFVPLPWLPCPRAAFSSPLSQVYEVVLWSRSSLLRTGAFTSISDARHLLTKTHLVHPGPWYWSIGTLMPHSLFLKPSPRQ